MRDTGLELHTEQFNAFTVDLAREIGATGRNVLRHEVARVMEAAIRKTEKATIASIDRSIARRSPWRTYDGKRYNITWRHPDARWNMIAERLAHSRAMKIGEIGHAKANWLEIANALQEEVKAPQKVRKQAAQGNIPAGAEVDETDDWRTTITINSQSRALFYGANGRQVLFAAITGRIEYFRNNMRRGVFDSASATAKKYKGITVRP